ncbi:ARHGG factor, partial [Pomatorhinus ruficollis]|nr:ARHGG factor [Pomatorhinus ruficollis]
TNPLFKETLKQIERKPECGGLPLISFLILPMQRVTRLPLLLDTVQQKTNARTAAYGAATRAVKAISKVRPSCQPCTSPPASSALWSSDPFQPLISLPASSLSLFLGLLQPFPLISVSRWLLKRGELLLSEESGIFRRGAGRLCHLFLFNDVLIITKKK